MKARLQKMAVILRIPLAIFLGVFLFSSTFPYWSWHVVHGSHTQVKGVRIWVPYSYRAFTFDEGRVLSLTPWPGLFPSHRDQMRGGSIRIDFLGPNQGEPGLMIGPHPGPVEFLLSGPFQESSKRELTIAGRSGECREYAFDLQSSKNALADEDTRTIYCRFAPDLRASFVGGASAQRKFYEVIQSAELVRGKR